ncbi:hypothetical protein OEZ85_002618 [Tetradesmus obliquus]|uniref:Uncharacterized protein n=1 Tax=Tetradesmus obliquus TaxID=3088 RepID=A0ABY8TYI1_TETOB|nr:hypothetical protein OEZ85_002618 [Tetradesmus obliquus]
MPLHLLLRLPQAPCVVDSWHPADGLDSQAAALLQQQYARALHVSFCKSGSIPGLVRRLLLLEAVQQPVPWSMLAPGLQAAWQQQQHADLARATHSSSSSSSSSSSHSAEMWMPQLLSALLRNASDRESAAAREVAGIIRAGQGSLGPAAAAAAAAAAHQLDGVARYALVCLADPGCRYSLTCWVLAWHAALAQQGGEYSSAADR